MRSVNWRLEGLFLAMAGMETCWVVGGTRLLAEGWGADIAGLSSWSVWALFLVALSTVRVLDRLQLRLARWVLGALALFTSFLLLLLNSGSVFQAESQAAGLNDIESLVVLSIGFFVWFRSLRIPMSAGHTRVIAQHFQIGMFIMAGQMMLTLAVSVHLTDLILAYFMFGLLAVALTRLEEIARTGAGDAVPLDLRWSSVLAAVFLVSGVFTLLGTRLVTVELGRALLRPFAFLLRAILYVAIALFIESIRLLLPLLQHLFKGIKLKQVEQQLEDLELFSDTSLPESADQNRLLSQEFMEALWATLIVVLILLALVVLMRSFRRWQVRRYSTPGGVRERVAGEGSLVDDLAGFMGEQWRRLRAAARLRRLLQRVDAGSVRAMYASLLALLAAAEHPRQPEQTPNEYEPVAHAALPACQAEITAITEAYVRARYGELEIGAEELARLQRDWKNIKSDERWSS